MLSYTAWNTWGNFAAALSGHGNNVLLNIFFGPPVNAGRSVATQANGALNSFVQNIQAAINPQIIKLYASGDIAQVHSLVLHASKYNFLLLLTLGLPVLLNAEVLLGIWLVEVPPYAEVFLKLTIVASLVDSFSGPLMTSAQATGHIRLYHTVVGMLLLLNVPISYVFLLQGFPPETVLIITIGLAALALIARIVIISPLIKLPIINFFSRVLVRSFLVVGAASMASNFIQSDDQSSLSRVALNLTISMAITVAMIWLAGLNRVERKYLSSVMRSIGNRLN
ncbi:hypothetical protein D3C78_1178620 [compost metagenome]